LKVPAEVTVPTPSPSTVYAFTLNPNAENQNQALLPIQIPSSTENNNNLLQRDSETQTNIPPPPLPEVPELAHKSSSGEICDLVEKYLEQKRIPSQNMHYDKILSSIYKRGGGKEEEDGEEEDDHLRKRESLLEFERIEKNVSRMKDEFEEQWVQFEGKVRDSGIQELKTAFLSEIKVSHQ
jgi:hypothetical protein